MKILMIIGGIFCFLGGLWVIGRLTNMLQFYSLPTYSNYPGIKMGEKFFTSNLLSPQRFDFIAYHAVTEMGDIPLTHRLCGLEGDTLEMKAGVLFVNGKDADSRLTLAHNYVIPRSFLSKLPERDQNDLSAGEPYGEDSINLFLSDKEVVEHHIPARRLIHLPEYNDSNISVHFSPPANQDYFGPVVVPKGKYFVLGDNRWNAQDSRYRSFVDKADLLGTIMGK